MKSLYIENSVGFWTQPPLKVKFFSLALLMLGILFSASPAILLVNIIVILIICLAGGGGLILLKRLKPFVFFGLFIILFHSILNPANETYYSIFGLEGFLYGSVVAMRLTGIVVLGQIALMTTPPKKIFLLFSSYHKDLGMIMLLLIGFIPVLEEELSNTSQAQQTRGLVWTNLPEKIKAYLAMIIPVIIKALYRAQGMASLLHLRGYEEHNCSMARKVLMPLWTARYKWLATGAVLFMSANILFFIYYRI